MQYSKSKPSDLAFIEPGTIKMMSHHLKSHTDKYLSQQTELIGEISLHCANCVSEKIALCFIKPIWNLCLEVQQILSHL